MSGGKRHPRPPQVGELTLNRENLAVGGVPGLMLVIYHPDPASTDADKLTLLASYTEQPSLMPHAIVALTPHE